MFFLSKLLPIFVLPLGLATALLVVGLVRQKRGPVIAALILLYLASLPFVGTRLIGWLESNYPAVPVAEAGPADAVVVLGGIFGPSVKTGLLPNYSESVERLEAGIALAQAGRAPLLVFSGARVPWVDHVRVEGDDSKAQAILRGVPADKILVTREVVNTADEAQAVAHLMREHQWRRIILVTSGWHMPRALYLFKRAGVECEAFPVDFRRDRQRPLSLLDFLPNPEGLVDTDTTLHELYGSMYYRLVR